MPINHDHKSIFIHIPKTGGTTILFTLDYMSAKAESLYGSCTGNMSMILTQTSGTILQHLYSSHIKKAFPLLYSQYFKFAFTRNPYDRLVSEYLYRKTLPEDDLFQQDISFSKFVARLSKLDISSMNHKKSCHIVPQWQFLTEEIDQVYRYENYSENLLKLLDRLSPGTPVPSIRYNASEGRKGWPYYYSERRTRQIVYDIYKEDFKRFDYKH